MTYDRLLFTDKFRSSYTVNGPGGRPSLLYKSTEKSQEAVVYECCHGHLYDDDVSTTPCLIGLTSDGWLVFRALYTGQVIRRIYLSRHYRLRHLTWESDFQRIVLKSIRTARVLDGSTPREPFLTFAVLTVGPLELTGLFHVEKRVFGDDIVDAAINQFLLVVFHRSGVIEFFDFNSIVRDQSSRFVKLFEPFSDPENFTEGIVGEPPLGIPCTIDMSSRPQPLLQLTSHQNHVAFGGFPYHYISCPSPKHRDLFHVCHLESQKVIENGQLQRCDFNLEDDCAFFHPDFSNSVIHVGSGAVYCYDIIQKEGMTEMGDRFCINVRSRDNEIQLSDLPTTSSGRQVKRRCNLREVFTKIPDPIQAIDYEDELELFVITASLLTEDGIGGQVLLCDKSNGCVLQRIILDDWCDNPCTDHRVVLDRDVLIHMSNAGSKGYHCFVYRLQREALF